MKSCPTCKTCYEDDKTTCVRSGHKALQFERLGTRFIDNKYRLDSVLGHGGNGTVYVGTHLELGHHVAIKLLRRDFAKADPNGRLRLRQEALTACNFDHPNLVRLYDLGTYQVTTGNNGHRTTYDELYVVMQLIQGQTLKEFLTKHGRLEPSQAIEIAGQIAAGLTEIHSHNIVHRDLKPANIMLTHDRLGQLIVKILDFGAIKLVGETPAPPQLDLTGQMFIGSPLYSSPESCTFQRVDARSDIYCLGLILYEMLAGERPYQADDFYGWLNQHASGVPRPLSRVPNNLAGLVMQMLAKRPENRPQSAMYLLTTLNELRQSLGSDEAVETDVSNPKGFETDEDEVTIVGKTNNNHPGGYGPTAHSSGLRTTIAIVVLILSLLSSLFLTVNFLSSSLAE